MTMQGMQESAWTARIRIAAALIILILWTIAYARLQLRKRKAWVSTSAHKKIFKTDKAEIYRSPGKPFLLTEKID